MVSPETLDLFSSIKTSKPDGIIFWTNNLPLVMEILRLLELEQPDCCRFVVCERKNESVFHSWKGVPPVVLKEDDDAEGWGERLDRTFIVHRLLMNPEFKAIIPYVTDLPSLPESHHRIVQALRDPDFHVADVARLISQDVALTAQLLKTVNSAAIGLSEPVRSVAAAISVIGATRVQALVMSSWAFFFSQEKSCRGFSPVAEWQHALAVAEVAQQLGRDARVSTAVLEDTFTAGILHDVGKVLQAANSPDAYSVILADARKKGKTVWEMEKEYFTYTHAELGGCMLAMWGLALPVVEAVAWHHLPEPEPSRKPSPRALVYAANRQVHQAGPAKA